MIKQLFLIQAILLIGTSHAEAQLLQSLKSTAQQSVQHQTTGRPLVPSNTKPVPTERFEHEFQLDPDGNFWLFWTVNGDNITFETHVRTRGYIGFGLSPNGKMFPSDVVVGWVKADGTVHFQVKC